MTRLRHNDIQTIAAQLDHYNQELLHKTGRGLLGIACHSYGADEAAIRGRAASFSTYVVPCTAGEGIIGDFSETVCAILRFLEFPAETTAQTDTAGIALAFEKKADALFMSDDDRFVGLNLHTRFVADNSVATGKVYSAALDLMAGGVQGKDVLVLGCGPVGTAAALHLLDLGARVALYDSSQQAALAFHEKYKKHGNIIIEKDRLMIFRRYRYILDATPVCDAIPDGQVTEGSIVAAPGVPLGISMKDQALLQDRLIHDKLELGVAAMAVALLSSTEPGDHID